MSLTDTKSKFTRADFRVIAATTVGTTIEWYDFFIYANTAALVFDHLYFKALGENALLIAFATIGLSFLFRPLGAVIAGHLGDRIGRRAMLVLTLSLMGGATTLIGFLPTSAQAGIIAPILLLLLRILQGISAGGEWGGAVLMAVEHAPDNKRGLYGAFPQLGVPVGMLIASGVLLIINSIFNSQQYLDNAWRIPFLLSVVMLFVGYIIRRKVDESPVFEQIRHHKVQSKMPLFELFRRYGWLVLLAALSFAGNNAAGYMVTGGYLIKYSEATLHIDRGQLLVAVTISSFVWAGTTFLGGWLSDIFKSRRTVYIIGYLLQIVLAFPLFLMVESKAIIVIGLAFSMWMVTTGLTYGPQSAYFSEIFPARLRYTGVSIAYALGAIIGGAFSPTIAQWLQQVTGNSSSVAIYLAFMGLVALLAVLAIKDRWGRPLIEEADITGAQPVVSK